MFKAFSNCKNYVVAGVLMRSHWKYIRTDDLEVVFSRGSGIQLGLFSRNLEPWKPKAGKTSDTARPVQAVCVECDTKDASKLIKFFKYIFPSSVEDKKKLGPSLSLGFSFNFVPLFSNRKTIKLTPDVLQRLIDSQKNIFENFVKEEQCDDIKTNNMDGPLLRDKDGSMITLQEYLMGMKQKKGLHK